jgi:tungstate transport system substrate-binding protein
MLRRIAAAFAWLGLVAVTVPALAQEGPSAAPTRPALLLATTTSTQDSGILDVLIPLFEKQSGYRVKTIAVGTGEALKMGGRGDADVLIVHDPSREKKLVEEGAFVNRRLLMHNHFLVVGPASDPAGLRGATQVTAAFQQIATKQIGFVSRGDDSGTHSEERSLWTLVDIRPAGSWYIESGEGMGATLLIASQKNAYTLTDRGTHLAFRGRTGLVPYVEGDGVLLNVYSVMEVNPARFPKVNAAGARALSEFLVSPAAQAVIESFGVDKYGEPLFVPDAGKSEESLGG